MCAFVCASVCPYTGSINLTAGSVGWLTDFSHFLGGKVACTAASGDCSGETEEHMKSINSWCYYLPTLLNTKRRSHIYKCSQHVTSTLSPCITNVWAASLIKGSVILMRLRACDKICRNVSDKRTKLPPTVVVHYNCFQHGRWAQYISLHDFHYISGMWDYIRRQLNSQHSHLSNMLIYCFTPNALLLGLLQEATLKIWNCSFTSSLSLKTKCVSIVQSYHATQQMCCLFRSCGARPVTLNIDSLSHTLPKCL